MTQDPAANQDGPAAEDAGQDVLQVVTACAGREEALRLARGAVEARLAACAQVTGAITSVYRWQGAIEEADEVLCIFKTRREVYPALETYLRAQHSYQTPEILAFSIALGSGAYLQWLREALAEQEG